MPLNNLAEILYSTIMTPLWFVYILTLTREWRYSKSIVLRIILLLMLGITTLHIILYVIWGRTFLIKTIMSVITLFLGIAVILMVSKYRGWRMAFLFFTAAVFILLGEALCDAFGFSTFLVRIIAKIIIYGLLFLFLYRFRSSLSQLLEEIQTGWSCVAMVPISLSLCFLFLIGYGKITRNFEFQVISILLSVMTLTVYIAFHYLFDSLRAQFQLKENWNLLQTQISSLQRESGAIYRTSDEIRLFRHDMRHFMQIQAACLNSGDVEGAKKILASMGENLDGIFSHTQIHIYTRIPLIDSVLSQYDKLAETNGIQMSVRLDLPQKPPADPADLAVVIANSLENALHACLNIPSDKSRCIRIYGGQNQSQFFLEISNTFVGKIAFNEDRTLPITKIAGHGYGTRSIAAFAKKYDALVDYQAENGWFRMRILF